MSQSAPTANHRKRLKAALNLMQAEHSASALVVSSATNVTKSRDQTFPFRQSSDFYYLTGSSAQDLILLLSTKHRAPRLIAPKASKEQALWEGPGPDLRQLANHLGAELLITKSPSEEVMQHLKQHHTLFFQNERGSRGWARSDRARGRRC